MLGIIVSARTFNFPLHVVYVDYVFNSFNQLDLPEYETSEQMREKLQLVLSEGTEGFAFV